LDNQWEILGCLQGQAMPLEEYIILYFLKTHDLRRTAESKLFEFLVSLRNYSKKYSRAAMFSFLANIG
jgi:hypothetical protein